MTEHAYDTLASRRRPRRKTRATGPRVNRYGRRCERHTARAALRDWSLYE